RTVLPLVALGVLAASGGAGDKDKPKKPLTARQCEDLVKQLVNPDKPPFKERYVLNLTKEDLDNIREKQAKIAEAYEALSASIETALPVLVKNVGDERFSYVCEESNGAFVKRTVGGACYDIIAARVEVYHRHVRRDDGNSPPRSLHFIGDECGGVEKWWGEREGKALAELPLEALR